jgi:hypothetical protein
LVAGSPMRPWLRRLGLAALLPFTAAGWIVGMAVRVVRLLMAAIREGFDTGSRI